MATSPSTPSRLISPAGKAALILAAAIVCVGCLLLILGPRFATPKKTSSAELSLAVTKRDDPRLTFATYSRNVRPEVQYVGDNACAQCHPDQMETFRHHPMGRSLMPMAAELEKENYDKETHNPFDAAGFHYQIRRDGSKVIHRESFTDSRGKEIMATEAPVSFKLGSGTRGATYLVNRDGYLFESPISWFSQRKIWDISPGYEEGHFHFERGVSPACLFCHSNRFESISSTTNRYQPPIFQGTSIGCERCHGPGELHVKEHEAGGGQGDRDDTIVNPRRLEPALREAVCQQCHLQGLTRVLRRGRDVFDYRPGLPLHLFLSIFVLASDEKDHDTAVSQVEQMMASRCYQASEGKLGCISCHNPHRVPAPQEKVSFYKDRCLKCHETRGCTLPLAAREQKQPGDNCAACHMPRRHADIAHTSLSDHRVLRRPDSKPQKVDLFPRIPGALSLSHFHHDLSSPEDPEFARDLAVALVGYQLTPEIARKVLPPLKTAVDRAPDDLAAWESLGRAHLSQNQTWEALRAFETILGVSPGEESALAAAANCARRLDMLDRAVEYARRAVAVNPWRSNYRVSLGWLLFVRADVTGALEEVRAAIRINPAAKESRVLLINCLLKNGSKDQARKELENLISLYPTRADELRQLFNEQIP